MKKNVLMLVAIMLAAMLALSACITVTEERTVVEDGGNMDDHESMDRNSDEMAGDSESGVKDMEGMSDDSKETETKPEGNTYSKEEGGFADEGDGVLGLGGGAVDMDGLCPPNTYLSMTECRTACANKEQGFCEEVEQYPGCFACWELEDSGCLQGEFTSLEACEDQYGDDRCVRVPGPASCFKKGSGR